MLAPNLLKQRLLRPPPAASLEPELAQVRVLEALDSVVPEHSQIPSEEWVVCRAADSVEAILTRVWEEAWAETLTEEWVLVAWEDKVRCQTHR